MASPSHQTQTLYQLLGVRPQASAETIRRAYRLLSKRYHPDTSFLPPEQAIRRFQELNDAYEVLNDPAQRAIYDASLQLWQKLPSSSPTIPARSPLGTDMEARPLSGNEVFALILMAGTFVLCLALAGALAWLREGNGIGLG